MAKASNQYVSVSFLTYFLKVVIFGFTFKNSRLTRKFITILSLNMTDMCVIAFMNYLTIMKFSNLKKNVSLNGIIC